MDAILNAETIDNINSLYSEDPLSLWIKDGDIYRSSSKLTLSKKLVPGVYTIYYTKEFGTYLKGINYTGDTLYKFTDDVVDYIFNEIEQFWKKEKLFKEEGFLHKRGILLTGPPGTGKSSMIQILCENVVKNNGMVFKVQNPDDFPMMVGFLGTEFRQIEPETPMIVILEKLENYLNQQELLEAFLDATLNNNHMIVLATTNNYEEIPQPILRASRFDLKIEVPLPSSNVRAEFLLNKNMDKDLVEEVVSKTNNFSLAELKEFYILHKILDVDLDSALERAKSTLHKNGSFQTESKFGIH